MQQFNQHFFGKRVFVDQLSIEINRKPKLRNVSIRDAKRHNTVSLIHRQMSIDTTFY